MNVDLKYVETLDEANEFMRWLGERRPVLGVDTETGGLEWWKVRLRLVQFGDANTGWIIPWERWGGLAVQAIKSYQDQMVMHNAKFDVHMLYEHEPSLRDYLPWQRVDDTGLMAHILKPNRRMDLKGLAKYLIDPNADTPQDALDTAMQKQGWTWDDIPLDFPVYWAYAGMDTVYTARLWEIFEPQVRASYNDVYMMDLAVADLLFRMETRGMLIDVPYCQAAYDSFRAYEAEGTAYVENTYGVRPTSNTKLADKLQELGFGLTKLTKGGNISVDGDVLRGIPHDLAQQSLRVRQIQKVASTYLKNFLRLIDDDNFLHGSVKPLGARTGRMSMSDPNLQNLPRDHEGRPEAITVRNCFIPRPDHMLVMADFDQIEQRMMAHYAWLVAGDPGMVHAFASDDIFTEMARRIYDDDTVVKRDPRRQMTKNAAYAKAYGAGAEKFSLTAGVPVSQGEAFLARYDELYPGVRAFQRSMEDTANSNKQMYGEPCVQAPSGRMHYADDRKIYTLVNYLIQGAAGDVLKQKMLELDQAGLGEFMVLPVHDEIIFDVPREHVRAVVDTCMRVMPETEQFTVPLTVGVEWAERWGDKYAGVPAPPID